MCVLLLFVHPRVIPTSQPLDRPAPKPRTVSPKSKQKSAKDDIKRIEKDMAEFKDNKEGKTDQLRVGCTMVDHRS